MRAVKDHLAAPFMGDNRARLACAWQGKIIDCFLRHRFLLSS